MKCKVNTCPYVQKMSRYLRDNVVLYREDLPDPVLHNKETYKVLFSSGIFNCKREGDYISEDGRWLLLSKPNLDVCNSLRLNILEEELERIKKE